MRPAGALILALGLACGSCGDEVAPPVAVVEPGPDPVTPETPARPWDLLTCSQDEAGLWMTDPSEPPPGARVADILRRESDPAAGLVAVELYREAGQVWVGLQQDGLTTSMISLDRWRDTGSWYVESGIYCDGAEPFRQGRG